MWNFEILFLYIISIFYKTEYIHIVFGIVIVLNGCLTIVFLSFPFLFHSINTNIVYYLFLLNMFYNILYMLYTKIYISIFMFRLRLANQFVRCS